MIKEQNLSIEEFNDVLKKWSGESIKIMKQEIDDQDEIMMDLSNISFETNSRRIDDYLAKHTLHLYGDGKVKTEDARYEPLPDSQFEVPIYDGSTFMYDGSRLYVQTERGNYIIEITL